MTISIRRKKTKNGISLFLDYNTKANRYEFLKLYLFDEELLSRKLTRAEKEHNKEIEIKVELIRGSRMKEHLNGTFKLYGIEHKQRLESVFLPYFDRIMNERANTSDSNMGNWRSARNHWVAFTNGRSIRFVDVTVELLDDFRRYLLTTYDKNGIKRDGLARNSASSYFTKLRVVINQAVKDHYFVDNPLNKVKSICPEETKREILTIDEMAKLSSTPCNDPILKRAFLFSCFTGIRHSDVKNLKWENVQYSTNTGYFIRFRQQKSKGEVLIYISEEAYSFLGPKGDAGERIFNGLYYSAWKNIQLRDWCIASGITRKITFHSARHSFATNQLNAGTDITVLSNILGHKQLKTTLIYAKVTNKSKLETVNRISIKK